MSTGLREIFSKRLKEAIASSAYSQRSLAEKINVTPSTIQRWVNGQVWPDPETIDLIARTLQVSPEWFFGADSITTPQDALKVLSKAINSQGDLSPSPINHDILEALDNADEHTLQSIRDLLDIEPPLKKKARL